MPTPITLQNGISTQEFNLSILREAGCCGCEIVLSIPERKRKIVGYEAKMVPQSFAYQHTQRHTSSCTGAGFDRRAETSFAQAYIRCLKQWDARSIQS
jgi:hypothetical protein